MQIIFFLKKEETPFLQCTQKEYTGLYTLNKILLICFDTG